MLLWFIFSSPFDNFVQFTTIQPNTPTLGDGNKPFSRGNSSQSSENTVCYLDKAFFEL